MGRRDRGHGPADRPARPGRWWRWGPVVLVLVLLAAAGAAYRSTSASAGSAPATPTPPPSRPPYPRPPGLSLPALSDPAAGRRGRPTVPGVVPAQGAPRALAPLPRRPGPRPPRVRRRRRRRRARRTPPCVRLRRRDGDPGVDDEAAHRHRRAAHGLGPDHDVRDPGGAPATGAGSCWSAAATRSWRAGPTPAGDAWPHRADIVDPGPADRGRAARAGPQPRPPGVRRLPLLRAGGEPALAGRLRARRRRLADHRALGRRGPRGLRLRPGRRPVGDRGRRVRRPAGPQRREGDRSRRRRRTPPVAPTRSPAVQSAPLSRDRRVGAHRQRQRGRRGAGPPGRARDVAARAAPRPAPPPCSAPCSRLGVRHRHRARVRRQRAVAREPARARHPGRRAPGRPRARTTPSCAPSSPGCRSAGFTGSLDDRFAEGAPAGRGLVRAKTGTLTGVSSLAGTVTDQDGTTMVFALMADRVKLRNTLDAREGARPGCCCPRRLPLLARADPHRSSCRSRVGSPSMSASMVDWDLAVSLGSRFAGDGPPVVPRRGGGGGRRPPARRRPLDGDGARLHRAWSPRTGRLRCSSSTGPRGCRPTSTASPRCWRP